MKVYISGPITGLSQQEYEENFARAEAFLTGHGYDVINPVKVLPCDTEDCQKPNSALGWQSKALKEDGSYLHSYGCYMKYDIKAMLECDGIILIPGWRKSKGAQFELQVAQMCGLDTAELTEDMEVEHVVGVA